MTRCAPVKFPELLMKVLEFSICLVGFIHTLERELMINVLARLAIATLLWANMPKAYATSCIDLMGGFLTSKTTVVQSSGFRSWAMGEAKKLILSKK